jgi:hypothetical protein
MARNIRSHTCQVRRRKSTATDSRNKEHRCKTVDHQPEVIITFFIFTSIKYNMSDKKLELEITLLELWTELLCKISKGCRHKLSSIDQLQKVFHKLQGSSSLMIHIKRQICLERFRPHTPLGLHQRTRAQNECEVLY